jgi:hypothetical protein
MIEIAFDFSWVGLWDFKLKQVVVTGSFELLYDLVTRITLGGARFEVGVCAEWNFKFAEPLAVSRIRRGD